MKSKSEIDQHYGFTSDRACKHYLLSIAVMLLGFYSVFFLGLGILFLIGSFAKVSSTLKAQYLENGITVDNPSIYSTSDFKMNESDVVEEDEYSSDSFSLSDTTNPSSPTQIAWRQFEDDLRHR